MNTFNKLKAVIGLAFGDEGKGNTVAYLTNQEQQSGKSVLVVRFSGSSQATHTAQVDGVRHSFAHFGAGTLTGAHTFWSKFCPFEPLTFYHEYQKLLNMPSVPPIKFFADPLCPVVTPFDILANQYGQANLKHGTTGQGHGTTMQRQEDHYKLHLIDLTSEAVWLLKFENIKKYYQAKYPSINFGNPLELFRQRIAELFDIIEIMPLSAITRKYDSVICEGSQGILLDQDYGFFPHVTRSYTTTRNAEQLGVVSDVYYIMRSYLTRHGFGPLPNENLPFLRVNNPEETNQPNQFQGTLRYAPWDPDVIVNAMVCDASEAKNENRRSHLVITCLDQTANKIIITTDFGKSVSYFTVKQLLELLEFEFDSVLLCNGSGIENFHEYEFENAEVIS